MIQQRPFITMFKKGLGQTPADIIGLITVSQSEPDRGNKLGRLVRETAPRQPYLPAARRPAAAGCPLIGHAAPTQPGDNNADWPLPAISSSERESG